MPCLRPACTSSFRISTYRCVSERVYKRGGVMKIVIGMGLAVLLGCAPAMANHGPRDASVNQRQQLLEQRIEHGFRSGELTRHEYRRLRHEAREIDRTEHFFRADGRLTQRESGELHARLDR